MRRYVDLNGKRYSVSTDAGGHVSIWTSWDVMIPSTIWSVHPEYVTRSMPIRVDGRLGKKIMQKVVDSATTL